MRPVQKVHENTKHGFEILSEVGMWLFKTGFEILSEVGMWLFKTGFDFEDPEVVFEELR